MKIYKINSFINKTRSLFINFYDVNSADNYKEAQQKIKDHYSTSLITNLDGEVVQHVEYVPFGKVFIEERNNKWNTPYLFNAKELDEETGFYYYGARYYDPRTSVWLGCDPMQKKYPNVSTYAYCVQNCEIY
jgi:RHS repeat-associated protein